MLSLLTLAIVAFLICLVSTPLLRDLSLRAGLVDCPDAERKLHLRAVPRIGGIPIAFAYAGSVGLLALAHLGSSRIHVQHISLLWSLMPAAGIIFLTGLVDDLRGLKPWQKLAGQGIAALLAVSFGARLAFVHLPPWASFVLSLCWLIGCTNAFNLIDGMDGLATGISLIATLTTTLVALLSGNTGLAVATIPLVGALFAFLIFNFSPASVFLGDCGSLTIGFLLGCFSLIWSQHATNLLGMAAPVMALALPLLDVGLAICRRYLRNVPIFKGDRGHIHHRVLDLGFSTRGAALVLYAVCGLSASLAILANFARVGLGWPIFAVFCTLILIGIDRLDYVEWHAARRMFARISFRRAVQDEIYLVELRRSLHFADSSETCWQIVRNVCRDFHFASARLELHGKTFAEQFTSNVDHSGARFQFHFSTHDHLTLSRPSERELPPLLMSVLEHLQAAVREKADAHRLAQAA